MIQLIIKQYMYISFHISSTVPNRLDLSLSSLFWATFGMGDTKATLIDNRYLGSDLNLITSHTKHNPLVVLVGYALFWSYIAGAVVVLTQHAHRHDEQLIPRNLRQFTDELFIY